MADLEYTIGVNTNQAERNVDKLKRQVTGLGETFGKLRNLIGGLAIGGLVTNTIRWADAIQDVSDATNIATANILGFSQAVSESGGTAEDANNAVLRLSQTIGEAKEGNKAAIDSFAQIGLSLQDIKSMSDQDILRQVILSIGSISDASTRAALQVALLGKSMRGVQLDKVSAQYDVYVEKNKESAAAVKSAADAQENLGRILDFLKKDLLSALKPLTDFIASINTTGESFQRTVNGIKEFAKWVAYLIGIAAALYGLWEVVAIFRAWSATVAILGKQIGSFFNVIKNNKKVVAAIRENIKNVEKLSQELGRPMEKTLQILRQVEQVFTRLPGMIKGAAAAAIGFTTGFFGFRAGFNKEINKVAQDAEKIKVGPAVIQGEGMSRADMEKMLAKRRAELEAIAERNQKQKEFLEETREIGLEHFQNNLLMEDQARKAEILRNLMADISLTNKEISTKIGLQQLAAQNELIGLYGREYEMKAELLSIDAERQNQINDIIANLKSMGTEATAEDVARAQREIELAQYVADERLRIFKDRVAKEQAIEGSALEGVKASLRELADSVTPFNVAQQTTRNLFDGMMNGLEQFVMTGKFKFKDFALSLIRDLLMIQIRAQATQMFAMAGNFFSAMFAGRAAGGPVKGNTPYVVGEKGPELFVPKSAGTIVPNNKMSGGQAAGGPVTNNYITNNVNAIDAQSVAQFFAQNRKIALGAVEMARKELPYGVG